MAEGRSVAITLDRVRHLRYTFNAMCDLEEALGRSITEVAPSAGARFKLRDVCTFLWAGLRGEDPTLTVEGCGDLIQAALDADVSLAAISEKLREALAVAGFGDKTTSAGSEVAPAASPLPDAVADGSATPSA